jgi:hypothetical protein
MPNPRKSAAKKAKQQKKSPNDNPESQKDGIDSTAQILCHNNSTPKNQVANNVQNSAHLLEILNFLATKAPSHVRIQTMAYVSPFYRIVEDLDVLISNFKTWGYVNAGVKEVVYKQVGHKYYDLGLVT